MPSHTKSCGWAAPEQVLGMPVSFQTDQYPIGLMLVNLVQGILYGEEVNITIPIGGTKLERHTVLRNPGVYIDPDTAPVIRDNVDNWRETAEQCVRFNSNERFPSMAEMAECLQTLIEKETLTGNIEAPLNFGSLSYGDDGNGNITPCWLVN